MIRLFGNMLAVFACLLSATSHAGLDLQPATAPALKDNEDVAMQKWAEEKAKEIAVKHLEGWVSKINAAGSTDTLTSLAGAENYTVQSFTELNRNESSKMRVDNKPVAGAFQILRSAFEINTEGQVGTPALDPEGEYPFLASFTGRAGADPAQFEGRREGLKTTVEREKRQEAEDKYADALVTKHEVVFAVTTSSDENSEDAS